MKVTKEAISMEKLSLIQLVVLANSLVGSHGETGYNADFEYQHKVLESLVNLEFQNSQKNATIQSLTTKLEDALNTIKDLQSTVQELKSHDFSSGSTYVRWGKKNCPDGDSIKVYDGFAGGSWYSQTGNGANTLCLPRDPIYGTYNDARQSISLIYGTEYEFGGKYQDLDVPCSVCRVPRTSNIMLPARNECYPGWKLEYHGYLASQHSSYQRSEYICVDENLETTEHHNGGSQNGNLLYYVEARCGSLPCDTYIDGRELTCAVCSYSPLLKQTAVIPYV